MVAWELELEEDSGIHLRNLTTPTDGLGKKYFSENPCRFLRKVKIVICISFCTFDENPCGFLIIWHP